MLPHCKKYPKIKKEKPTSSDPYINADFCPEVRELPPKPYPWFSANPAITRALDWNVLASAPQIGHCQSFGKLCNAS